jgi:hypothetical protein
MRSFISTVLTTAVCDVSDPRACIGLMLSDVYKDHSLQKYTYRTTAIRLAYHSYESN